MGTKGYFYIFKLLVRMSITIFYLHMCNKAANEHKCALGLVVSTVHQQPRGFASSSLVALPLPYFLLTSYCSPGLLPAILDLRFSFSLTSTDDSGGYVCRNLIKNLD